MLITEPEYKNFIAFSIKNLKYLINVFGFYFNISRTKIKRKLSTSSTFNYPQRALEIASLGRKYAAGPFIKEDSPLGFTFELNTSLFSLPVNANFEWADLQDLDIADPEVFLSINRWYWLLYDTEQVEKFTTADIYKIVTHWVKCNPCTEPIIWEPYSTSERVSSLCIALLLRQDINSIKSYINNDEYLSSFFRQSLYHLTQHLEYYPEGITFNHVLNDLKGIAHAAIILEDKQMLDAVMLLIWQELDSITDKDGFLREGSSHYQLVVTRWLCELEFILTKAKKNKLADKLHGYTKVMMDKVAFFIVRYKRLQNIPLIGDISPDFDPAWVVNYFSFATSTSYGTPILKEIGLYGKEVYNEAGVHSYSEYTRINKGDWVLFVKHTSNDGTFFPAHAHEDYGSYVIFYKGIEIVPDPGRENYIMPPGSDIYCIPKSHNCLTVNKLPISLSVNHFYLTSQYKKANYGKEVLIDGQQITLTISTTSVSRITSGNFKTYNRTFIITNYKIQVLDNIEGFGKPCISSQITLSDHVKIKHASKGKFICEGDGGIRIDIISDDINAKNSDAYLCKRYGQATATTKIVSNLINTHMSTVYHVE